MSSKTGSSGPAVSLPKGGGALHGIGETFQPDLHTGTGNFTVPISLPPGRNGFQPQLALTYSSGSGNGPFGLGWNLGIPGISRKTSHGIPRYRDDDVFVLSGAEDLVPIADGASQPQGSVHSYRPRTEGLFARIVRHHDAENDYWEVRSKDGLVSLYGTPRPAGASRDWQDPAAVADPADPRRIASWKLTRTTDTFGNRIEYGYEREPVRRDGPHHWDQVYLAEIRYIDYGDQAPQFLATVRFVYDAEGPRPDPFSEYRSGFEIRTTRRCIRVEIATHANTEQINRVYHFTYLDALKAKQDSQPIQLPLNGVSLLAEVRVEGRAGDETEWLPPLTFDYTAFQPRSQRFTTVSGPDLPPGSLAHPECEIGDVFGNGLPALMEFNGTVRYWRNLGNGQFALPRMMEYAPAGVRPADPGVQLVDANGDGRLDLLVSTETIAGYYPMRFGGLWDSRSFQRYRQAPSFNLEDPEVHLVDLDGDGVVDAIRSSTRLECYFNDPLEGWNDTRRVERRALDVFPDVNFSDPRVKWADMSGDGLQDIVLVSNGSVDYWPSCGRGDWSPRVAMRNAPRFPADYDPRRILIGDVDGDGLADLVYVDDTRVTLWINRCGNRWSDPITVGGTPAVTDVDAVRLVDLNGTGVSGVLWSQDAGSPPRGRMFFLDFTGGVKPYLLDAMDNHMGAVTKVTYAPSTSFYLEDEKRPETRWKTPLPFPVQVVEHVESLDQISGGKLTTHYTYHHGYWDGAEREFRGFGRVDQRDTEIFPSAAQDRMHSSPTELRTWFHQGPIGDEFGDWVETDFQAEFFPEHWPGDAGPAQSQIFSRPAAMTQLINGLPRRVRRDALRTLRGQILRTELYALDGGPLADRPYTVTEYLHGLREEGPPGPNEADRPRIFFPHTLAQRVTQWERGSDPMTQFSFTDD
jgi:hypothetical protein